MYISVCIGSAVNVASIFAVLLYSDKHFSKSSIHVFFQYLAAPWLHRFVFFLLFKDSQKNIKFAGVFPLFRLNLVLFCDSVTESDKLKNARRKLCKIELDFLQYSVKLNWVHNASYSIQVYKFFVASCRLSHCVFR